MVVKETNINKKMQFDDYINELKNVTETLNKCSLIIFIVFLINLISSIIIIANVTSNINGPNIASDNVFVLFVALPIVGLCLIFFFEEQIKKGSVFYEEVTNSFEWKNAKQTSIYSPIDIKITTRLFLKSINVPLFGYVKTARAIYAILFIIFACINAYFYGAYF